MKVYTHVVLQVLMAVAQYGNAVSGYVPAKAVPFVALVIAATQGGLAWYNHYFTPAGTVIPPA